MRMVASEPVQTPNQFYPIPNPQLRVGDSRLPVWRIHLYQPDDPTVGFGLDINGQVVLGRAGQGDDFFNITPFGAAQYGVSRQHAQLRPTVQNLYILDMNSLNGTKVNNKRVSVHSPTSLSDGDILRLGHLELVLRIVDRPRGFTSGLKQKANLAEALAGMAKVIVSQRNPEEVMDRALASAMELTSATETAVWIIDDSTGDLFLQSHRGMGDEAAANMRFSIDATLPGKVVATGKPYRANASGAKGKIRVREDYMVESVIYVPLKLSEVTFGVIGAAHRDEGRPFTDRDETMLIALSDLAAVAIQNARLYQATDQALAQRVEELAAINELTALVAETLDLNEVQTLLKKKLVEQWAVESAELWLANDEVTRFSPVSQIADALTPAWHRVDEDSIVGWVIASSEPFYTNDVRQVPHFKRSVDGQIGIEARSMVCVPLQSHGSTVGALALFNILEGTFSKWDVDRLKTFAAPVASAAKNASLFRQSERERAIILELIDRFPGPLIILDGTGELQIVNTAAQGLIETHLADLMTGISDIREHGRGELEIGEDVYLATTQFTPAIGTLIVMQDITYRRQLEVAREEFVHGLSHDLKSPLSSITGYAQLLQDGDLTADELHFADNIVIASERMLVMINHLLDVARLTGDVKRKRSPLDLVEVVTDALQDLSGAALKKNIPVTFEVIGEPYEIVGERLYLHRSMLNLIDNAIKYSPEGAPILVELLYDADEAVIRVHDDGPGIPEEDLPHIFERYFRGKQDGMRSVGIGLGLELVRTTIEAHDGTISVNNAPGHGAEFTVRLPAVLEDE